MKIKKYAAISLLAGAFILNTVHLYEQSIDHDTEYCHLCDFLGLRHQANQIEKGDNQDRYMAFYCPSALNDEKKDEHFQNDHVINFATRLETPDGVKDLKKDFAIDEYGNLIDYERHGERVEVYDSSEYGVNLVRIFK